jgi:putative transposase
VKKRFTEEQIIGFLKEADKGVPVKELCRKHGFSDASYYLWRSKYGEWRSQMRSDRRRWRRRTRA